jgi:hypothetical protein
MPSIASDLTAFNSQTLAWTLSRMAITEPRPLTAT